MTILYVSHTSNTARFWSLKTISGTRSSWRKILERNKIKTQFSYAPGIKNYFLCHMRLLATTTLKFQPLHIRINPWYQKSFIELTLVIVSRVNFFNNSWYHYFEIKLNSVTCWCYTKPDGIACFWITINYMWMCNILYYTHF